MTQSTWRGIGAGIFVASLGIWFGLFAVQTSSTIGLAAMAFGIVFAMYAMAFVDGVEDAASVAYRSALASLVTAGAFVIVFQATQSPSFLVAAPVFALGVGGALGLPPVGQSYRTASRVAAVGVATVIAVLVFWVDHAVYAFVAPLLPLPAVGIADRIFDRGKEILAEEP